MIIPTDNLILFCFCLIICELTRMQNKKGWSIYWFIISIYFLYFYKNI